jgi:two-component system, cell cycle response regulator DivK
MISEDTTPIQYHTRKTGRLSLRKLTASLAPKKSTNWDTTVLIIDENVSSFVQIARMLGYMGIHCEWKMMAANTREYAMLLPRLDLILWVVQGDLNDNREQLQSLQATAIATQARLIAISTEPGESTVQQARQFHLDGVLSKPLDPDRFPDQIRRALAGETL